MFGDWCVKAMMAFFIVVPVFAAKVAPLKFVSETLDSSRSYQLNSPELGSLTHNQYILDTVVVQGENGEPVSKARVVTIVDGADVAADQQQAYWESLMKYKFWGSYGININNNGALSVNDESGYTGTAAGDIHFDHNQHLGGPILIGRNVNFGSIYQVQLTKGPFRTLGDVSIPGWSSSQLSADVFDGPYCIQGKSYVPFAADNDNTREEWINSVGNGVYEGAAYGNCPTSVPQVDAHLTVPRLDLQGISWQDPIIFGLETDTYYHIPPDSVVADSKYGTYDLYVTEISGSRDNLYFVMPPKGRLTRIFTRDGINLGNNATSKIQVIYVRKGAQFKDGKWDLTGATYVENDEYAGNLLYYTDKPIYFNPQVRSYQGSFITTDTLHFGNATKIAGQVIARKIDIATPFTGDFKYVPFDPPQLGKPEAKGWGFVEEGKSGAQKLNVALDRAPSTDVTFRYCFAFKGDNSKNHASDSLQAFQASAQDLAAGLPICNDGPLTDTTNCVNGIVEYTGSGKFTGVGEYCSATQFGENMFAQHDSVVATPIAVSVVDDPDWEWTERFYIRIFDLEGAVAADGSRSDEYYVEIVDNDGVPLSNDFTVVGSEDTDVVLSSFPSHRADGDTVEQFKVKIESIPDAILGSLTLDGVKVKVGDFISSEDLEKLVFKGAENKYSVNDAVYATIDYTLATFESNQILVPAVSYTLSIKLNPVNDAPSKIDTTYFVIKENSAAGTTANGSVVVTDVDDVQFTYSFDPDDANYAKVSALFDISSSPKTAGNDTTNCVLTLKNGAVLNYESADSIMTIRVVIKDAASTTDGIGKKDTSIVLTVAVSDENEAPVFDDKAALELGLNVDENSSKGDTVGNAHASDPDVWGKVYYTLEDVVPGSGDSKLFEIDDNGIITVAKDNSLDYEEKSTYSIKVVIADNGPDRGFAQEKDEVVVIISINDKEENPSIIVDKDEDGDDDMDDDEKCVAACDTTNRGSGDGKGNNILTVSVKENSATGTVVLGYYIDDEDDGEASKLAVSMKDNKGTGALELFEIDTVTVADGRKVVVRVVDEALLDFESVESSHEVTIYVVDPKGLKDSIVRVIHIEDVNENPVLESQPFTVAEHEDSATVVGKIQWDDFDKAEKFRNNEVYAIGGDVDLFDVGKDGTITTKKSFDYETEPNSYFLVVKVRDAKDEKLFAVDTIYIDVVNVPEYPVITSTEFDIPENSADSNLIGVLQSTDADDPRNEEKRTYALADSSDYVIVTEDGKILVKDSAKFDYEALQKITIKVIATDADGNSSKPTEIQISLVDQNEAPSVKNQDFEVKEDAKVGSEIGVVKAYDPDTLTEKFHKLTFSLVGESEFFKVNGDGSIVLKKTLDYEQDSVYVIKVSVADLEYADTAEVTIHVNDVVEYTEVQIVEVKNDESVWKFPDTLYTNQLENLITWTHDGVTEKMDTLLTEGKNVVVITYKEPTKNVAGSDTVVIYVSTAAPVVTVTAKADDVLANNVFTIVEKTDKQDSSIYVNSSKNDVLITVKDTSAHALKKDTSFTVSLDLKTVSLSKDVLAAVQKGAAGDVAQVDVPESEKTRTPINGFETLVSYTVTSGGVKYEVSYVENDSLDEVEIRTVSYKTTVDGKEVVVSFKADGVTGQLVELDSAGSVFTVSYEYTDKNNNTVLVSYVVDKNGEIVKNESGDKGYTVSYTYTNRYGNSATQSVYITLDEVLPGVVIWSPEDGAVIRSSMTEVTWFVCEDGEFAREAKKARDRGDVSFLKKLQDKCVEQDTLKVQGLEKGPYQIVRFYKDKAGNMGADTILVAMKDGKNVDISVVEPVTEMSKEKLEKFYGSNPPKPGETFAVSIRNPSTHKEVETYIGGSFKTEAGSGKAPYPDVSDTSHYGPTLGIKVKLPTYSDVGGVATLDELVTNSKNGKNDKVVYLEGVVADNSVPISLDEYVATYCEEGFDYKDPSKANLYNSKLAVKIWVYTTLGNFVDYFSFVQDLNDPSYANEAGMLELYFEQKPNEDGYVRTADGKLYATGAYLYKVEATISSTLRCTLPPVKSETGKKKGDRVRPYTDELLKPFGYKRPKN